MLEALCLHLWRPPLSISAMSLGAGLHGHVENSLQCVMARILQIALARAIRPEVDGGAPSLALLPTQGAAYASRHV